MSLSGLLWSTPLRRRLTSATAVFGFVAAFGGAVKAWPDLKPLMPAQRYWVDETVATRVAEYKPVINELMKWRLEDQKSKLESEAAGWNIQLPKETDQESRARIKSRLDAIERDKEKVDDRLRQLK